MSEVTAKQTEFAKRLTSLYHEYGLIVTAGCCELEGQLILESNLHTDEYIKPVWRSGSGGYIQMEIKNKTEEVENET